MELHFQFKDTDSIKVISGVRHSGKSVLLMQYRDYLQSQGVSAESIIYLNFESFEYQRVKNPDDFQVLITQKNIDLQSCLVDLVYVEYEKYGGFPSVVLADEMLKDTILSGIFDSIVLNDIAHRASVRYTHILKNVILFLADNVGQLVNPNKISNTLTSERVPTSNHTINKYLELLENAFLFYKAKQYDIRGKGYLKTNAKYFIARKTDEILYVQVAYDMPNNTHETDNLLHIRDNYRKILITGRYQPEKEIDGVPVVYVVDWLINE
ncbi:DUF4143 domain-containing protein [Actinobacillus vicugnae]|uniref:DUF4143 domain-containing protein n=1 Tax=Actinobacillus vicugnae TaxID=2573093 RepID=UPI00123FEA23|nr:AAA family ATPase [Actinobacillus vicugnae]